MVVRSTRREYDPYGNMACVQNSNKNGPCPQWAFSSSTNRLTTSGFGYDAPGNLTQDNIPAHTWQWDGEGRVSAVDPANNPPTWSFTYNAVGDRVQWAYPGGTDQHIFDPAGNWLGVYGVYDLIRLGDRLSVVYTGSETYFNHINHLSSTTMMTNHAGTAVEDILFYPWGQNTWRLWGSGGYSFANMPFYDFNTNTNYTMFRVYSQNIGRWHSPDPVRGDITNPQSLNRYAYVMNNHTTSVDPLGLCGETWFGVTVYDSQGNVTQPGTTSYGQPCESPEEQSQSNPPPEVDWGWGASPGDFGGGLVILPLRPPLSRQTIAALIPSCLSVTGQSINAYLQDQNSPMAGQGSNFVSTGWHYGVDPRFLVALAGAETSFGKNLTWGAYNAWNWGWNTPQSNSPFSSWAAGMHSVAKGMSMGPHYFRAGLTSTYGIYITGHYCVGPDCLTPGKPNGLPNLNKSLTDMGGNPANVPCQY